MKTPAWLRALRTRLTARPARRAPRRPLARPRLE
jgi:hypothetical protein